MTDPEPDLDVEKAQAALERAGADKPCPACDHGEWELDPMKYFMPGVSGGELLSDYGHGVIVVRCRRCGFIRAHSSKQLLD